jgi:hypothetical protein
MQAADILLRETMTVTAVMVAAMAAEEATDA